MGNGLIEGSVNIIFKMNPLVFPKEESQWCEWFDTYDFNPIATKTQSSIRNWSGLELLLAYVTRMTRDDLLSAADKEFAIEGLLGKSTRWQSLTIVTREKIVQEIRNSVIDYMHREKVRWVEIAGLWVRQFITVYAKVLIMRCRKRAN